MQKVLSSKVLYMLTFFLKIEDNLWIRQISQIYSLQYLQRVIVIKYIPYCWEFHNTINVSVFIIQVFKLRIYQFRYSYITVYYNPLTELHSTPVFIFASSQSQAY